MSVDCRSWDHVNEGIIKSRLISNPLLTRLQASNVRFVRRSEAISLPEVLDPSEGCNGDGRPPAVG
jgi:hypothetical protein